MRSNCLFDVTVMRKLSPNHYLGALLCLLTLFMTPLAGALNIASAPITQQFIGTQTQTPLLPDAAFAFSSTRTQHTVTLHWQIAPGHYLYRQHLHIAPGSQAVQLGTLTLPKGIQKHDEFLGDFQAYEHELMITVPVQVTQYPFTLKVAYQGCASSGYCYPPIHQVVHYDEQGNVRIQEDRREPRAQNNTQTDITNLIFGNAPYRIFFIFLGFGLLLSLTPCVLPLVPIISGIILSKRHTLTAMQAFLASSIYVLGLAITYAIAGVVAGLVGQNLQVLMQAPSVLITFSALLTLLALSQFGLFELRLPSQWQSKINTLSDQQKPSAFGLFIMGGLSALIVSPCVTPVLVGSLAYIAQTSDAIIGGLALFGTGLGMGAPLILVAVAGNRLLPKAGQFSTWIKQLFATLLLGMAVWLLGRFLPANTMLWLWGSFAIVMSGYFLWHFRFSTFWGLWHQLSFLLVFIYGVLLCLGAYHQQERLSYPFDQLWAPTVKTHHANFQTIHTLAQLNEIIAKTTQPVFVDFYADWCISCHHIEQNVIPDPKVQTLLAQTLNLKIDVTHNNADDRALQAAFHVIAPPAFLFFDRHGKELKHLRTVGEVNAKTLAAHLESAIVIK